MAETMPDMAASIREVLTVFATLLAMALLEGLRRYFQARTSETNYCRIRGIMAMLVLAAEQIFPASEGAQRGDERLEWVLRIAQKQYDIDADAARPALEAAVKQLR